MKALDGFSAKGKPDRQEQELLTELLAESFPAYEEYGDVPLADLEAGKRIFASDQRAMTCAVAKRMLFVRGKPSFDSCTAWADYETDSDFHHAGLFCELFKKLCRKKLDYTQEELVLLLAVSFDAVASRGTIVGHVERAVAKAAVSKPLRAGLSKARLSCWDSKLEKRIDQLLTGIKKPPTRALLRKPDPWALMADADIASSAETLAWKKSLQHSKALKTAKPGKNWRRQAAALVDEIGVAHFESTLLRWLVEVPRFADNDRSGARSATSFEKGNGTVLRAWIWTLRPNCKHVESALHQVASACGKKVPNIGPRSTVVTNACVGKLEEIATDDATRALFDLRYNTDYSTLIRSMDRALTSIATARGVSVTALEKAVDARAASVRRRTQAPEDSADLLASIYREPSSNDLRAVYADELTEQGDPRGEFIVLQQLEAMSKSQAAQAKALYKKYREPWLGPLIPVVRSAGLVYRRGFPAAGRLYGERRSELHRLIGHPAWSTIEELNVDGSHNEQLSPGFLAHPVMRRSLQKVTCLHIDDLAELATASASWSLDTVGLSYTEMDDLSNAQRQKIGAAKGLPKVTALVADNMNEATPRQWNWLFKSALGQQLQSLELRATIGDAWIWRAGKLIQTMERVTLPSHATYDFQRGPDGIQLAIKETQYAEVDALVETFAGLRRLGIKELTLSIPMEGARSPSALAKLTRVCQSMKLDRFKLPRPV